VFKVSPPVCTNLTKYPVEATKAVIATTNTLDATVTRLGTRQRCKQKIAV
jgi:hypothetical protein